MFRYMIWFLFYIILVNSVLDQGEFDVIVAKFEICKGAKRKNCTKSSFTLEDGGFVSFDMEVTEDTPVIKGRIVGMLNKKELLRIQIKNICEHIFFKPLVMMIFNETENCRIKKGHYAQRTNLAEISRRFYGGKFIYGNWTVNTLLYTDFCNLHCSYTTLIITPKSNPKSSQL